MRPILLLTLTVLFVSATFSAVNVPLEVSNWADVARTGEPVTAGVCLPEQAVYDLSKLRITDAGGTTVPAQFKALSKWWWEKNSGLTNDPSLKWVLCDFQADVAASGKTQFFLKDDNSAGAPSTALALTQDASAVTVVTGPLKFTVSKTAFNLFDQAWIDLNGNGAFEAGEQIIVSSAQNGAFVTAGDWAAGECTDGTVHQSGLHAPDRIVVEEEGPLKIVLRVEGRHYASSSGVSRGLYGYQVFITAYAGKPFVDVQWAVTNLYMEGDKPAETGTADPYEAFVWPYKEYRVDLNLNLGGAQNYTLLAETELSGSASGTPARLLQDSTGYTVTGGSGDSSSLGGAALYDGTKGLMVVMRDFAATNPRAFSARTGRLSVELTPNNGAVHWLDPYSRRNSVMRFQFLNGAYAGGSLATLWKRTDAPLRMLASREWYQYCNAWYRGFGIPPSPVWNRLAPSSWTRMNKAAGQQIRHVNDYAYSPLNWINLGQIGEFNGGGDHWNLTSCFYNYLLKGNPRDFETTEAAVYHFNNVIPVQLSWYDDPWTQLAWFLKAEDHLAGLNSYHGPTNNFYYNGTLVAFPGHSWHRSNVPDAGHMPNLELIEYYELTGDHATLDAIRAMGCRAIATIFGYAYFAANRPWDHKVALDSVFIMPYQQRYIARPGIVCQHAYEVTGDDRFLWPASIAAYSLRNYTRQNPVGYMGKPDDRSYLPNTDAGVLAIWQVGHPSDTAFPRSFHANDFMIGIADECLYGYIRNTGDCEIRDALIFSGKGHEWRAGMNGSAYTGFTYGGWADYLQEGRRYHQSVDATGAALSCSFTSSMAEGLGGLVFGYLMSGRDDLWAVIEDGQASHNPAGFDMKVIDMWQAYYKHDSLDITPPATVSDLSVTSEAGTGVRVSFTAPGDDGNTGTAAEYQVKFGPSPIVDMPDRWNASAQTGWPDFRPPVPYTAAALVAKAENYKKTTEISFWAAQNVAGEPAPQAAGTAESFVVGGLENNMQYYCALVSYDDEGNVSGISNVTTVTTGIVKGPDNGPLVFKLYGNYPNPFNPATRIRYSLPYPAGRELTRLSVYDTRGRLIRTLVSRVLAPGAHQAFWDGRDASGRRTASGLYMVRLSRGRLVQEKRMVLVQ